MSLSEEKNHRDRSASVSPGRFGLLWPKIKRKLFNFTHKIRSKAGQIFKRTAFEDRLLAFDSGVGEEGQLEDIEEVAPDEGVSPADSDLDKDWDDYLHAAPALPEEITPRFPDLQNKKEVAGDQALDLSTLIQNQEFQTFCRAEKINAGGMGEIWKISRKKMNPTRQKAQQNFLAKYPILQGLIKKEGIVVKKGFLSSEKKGAVLYEGAVLKMTLNKKSGRHQRGIVKPYYLDAKNQLLAMEYLPGQDLEKMIQDQGQPPLSRSLDMMLKITESLRFIHSKKVIHRDIKPANIQIEPDGNPTIIDFGIAYDIDNFQREEKDSHGSLMYMSPEQAQNIKIDFPDKTDVYGLGTVFYELLTGEQFISKENYARCFAKEKRELTAFGYMVMMGNLKEYARYQTFSRHKIKQENPGLPANLIDLCFRMLDFDPMNRPSLKEVQLQILQSEIGQMFGVAPTWKGKILDKIKQVLPPKTKPPLPPPATTFPYLAGIEKITADYRGFEMLPQVLAVIFDLAWSGNPQYLPLKKAVLNNFMPENDPGVILLKKILAAVSSRLPPKMTEAKIIRFYIEKALDSQIKPISAKRIQEHPVLSKLKWGVLSFLNHPECPAKIRQDILNFNLRNGEQGILKSKNKTEFLQAIYNLADPNSVLSPQVMAAQAQMKSQKKQLNLGKLQRQIQFYISAENYGKLAEVLGKIEELSSRRSLSA